jgi:hypothetical protein
LTRRFASPDELDLLPYVEPAWRVQLAHPVGHERLIGALRRISADAGGSVSSLDLD